MRSACLSVGTSSLAREFNDRGWLGDNETLSQHLGQAWLGPVSILGLELPDMGGIIGVPPTGLGWAEVGNRWH
jgi:hypothetical protein